MRWHDIVRSVGLGEFFCPPKAFRLSLGRASDCRDNAAEHSRIYQVASTSSLADNVSIERNSSGPIVIIGAGQAGGWAARTLRADGYRGAIVLIGDEDHPPYERPPLSKAVLAGEAEPESTYIFEHDIFAGLDLDFRRRESVTRVAPHEKRVHCASGQTLAYDRLLLATGGRARPVAVTGLEATDILLLRTLEDALAMRSSFQKAKSVAIIGGGWIGLECAATAHKAGIDVHLFEMADRLCARAAPPLLSDYLLDLHRRHGTRVHLSNAIQSGNKQPDGRYSLQCRNGETLEVDAIVAGVGLIPNDQLARDAGLAVDNGIVTDATGLTSNPSIFAAGDVANSQRLGYARHMRLESWANAQDQGVGVAKAMLGRDGEFEPLPWFWSDQFDVNIQIAGMPDGDMTCITRGDPQSDRISAFYLRDNRMCAAVTANRPRDMSVAKRLISHAISVSPEDLADEAVSLKRLLKKSSG